MKDKIDSKILILDFDNRMEIFVITLITLSVIFIASEIAMENTFLKFAFKFSKVVVFFIFIQRSDWTIAETTAIVSSTSKIVFWVSADKFLEDVNRLNTRIKLF